MNRRFNPRPRSEYTEPTRLPLFSVTLTAEEYSTIKTALTLELERQHQDDQKTRGLLRRALDAVNAATVTH